MFKTVFRAGDYQGAYAIASHSGLVQRAGSGGSPVRAGWLAYAKLRQPKLADEQFAKLQAAGGSPITQARALYWRGRVADAEGDPLEAQLYYGQAAKNSTTFYGQLAATRGGSANLVLGHDPEIGAEERAKFESRDWVKAARLLYQLSPRDGFRTFVMRPGRVGPDRRRRGHARRSGARLWRPGALDAGGAQRGAARLHPARARLSDRRASASGPGRWPNSRWSWA